MNYEEYLIELNQLVENIKKNIFHLIEEKDPLVVLGAIGYIYLNVLLSMSDDPIKIKILMEEQIKLLKNEIDEYIQNLTKV